MFLCGSDLPVGLVFDYSLSLTHAEKKKKSVGNGFIVAQKRSAKYSSREVRKIKDHRGWLLIFTVGHFFKTLSLCLFALAACNHPGHKRVSHPFVHISNTSRRRLFDLDFSANHGRRDRHLVMLMRDEGVCVEVAEAAVFIIPCSFPLPHSASPLVA